jgi:hypothetical protein
VERVLTLVMCVAAGMAWADTDARFAKLRDSAEPVGGLGAFLDKYVGECSAMEGGANCQQAVREYRQKMRGKRLYMIINEENATMLSPGGYDFSRGQYSVNITPFFASSGYALTHGAPHKTDGNGNPVMPFLTVNGKAPDDWNQMRYTRLFSSRELRLQVIFTPQDTWALPKKGGGKMSGVRAKIDAILVTVGRTGEFVGLWLNK